MTNPTRGTRGMAVAPHALAAQSALAILREGGNAVEAMVAAAAAIAVVYPHMNSIGGDGFWLVHVPGEAPRALMLYAKTARGLMARFAIDHRIDRTEGLKAFDTAGYGFNAALSSTTDWVFTRLQPPPKNPRAA